MHRRFARSAPDRKAAPHRGKLRFPAGKEARPAGFSPGIEPTGMDPGVDAALYIACETVAYDYHLVFLKAGHFCKAGIEKFDAGLIIANALGDKYFLEKVQFCSGTQDTCTVILQIGLPTRSLEYPNLS